MSAPGLRETIPTGPWTVEASYWLVEPDSLVLTVLELVDGVYEQVAQGEGTWSAQLPFPVDVTTAALLR